MNHVYRVIWNRSAACWQAVSETARGQSKSSKSTTTLLKPLLVAASMAVSGIAVAAPTGGVVTSGTASIGVSGSTTTINQSTSKAIINWNDFSIASGETVNFVQPDANAIALNRVVTATPSSILGNLNANGQVFIVNPNGITFGSTAQVNVGGLVASTLDISDSDFNNGTYRFANSSNNASITNQGAISVANTGTAALIAPSIQQAGSIVNNDGSILLTAASDVTLSLTNRTLNSQTIHAGHNTATVNHSAGTIQADGGKVILTAQGVNSSSTASISSAGSIRAQTLAGNDRGAIDLISDMASGAVSLTGTLDASAPTNGFGGTIRTIGADVAVSNSASVTTRKVNQTNLPGTSSYWQIKANSINVGSGGTISGSELSSSLNDGSVTLTASGTGTGQGNININDAVSTNSNVILNLAAAKDINFNNNVGLTANLGRLVMSYGSSNDYNLNNNSKITLSGAGATLRLNSTDYTIINSLGVAGDTTTTTLQGMKNNLTGNYALGSDIDASATSGWNSGKGFDPIGNLDIDPSTLFVLDTYAFKGQFHGLGHTIDSLFIDNHIDSNATEPALGDISQYAGVGLFGYATNHIRNVGLTDVDINGFGLTGGLVGMLHGKVSHSYVTGSVVGEQLVGGLVGGDTLAMVQPEYAHIENSYSTADVSGYIYVGGLVGSIENDSIVNNSHATGNVTGLLDGLSYSSVNNPNQYSSEGLSVGGLIGATGGTVTNSYATGNVVGRSQVGGLIGKVYGIAPSNAINYTYSTGSVDAFPNAGGASVSSVGGLIGSANTGTVTNSYWDTTTSGQSTSAGGTGKTTAELKQIATFTGWDIADVSNTTSNSTWVIDEDNATPWLR
jgi:filamentous hemagglutinin family protein